MYDYYRSRIPRAFGRGGALMPYDVEASAAQYIADTISGFQREPRMLISHHLHVLRRVDANMNMMGLENVINLADLRYACKCFYECNGFKKRDSSSRSEVFVYLFMCLCS